MTETSNIDPAAQQTNTGVQTTNHPDLVENGNAVLAYLYGELAKHQELVNIVTAIKTGVDNIHKEITKGENAFVDYVKKEEKKAEEWLNIEENKIKNWFNGKKN
jgi:hypothetical protein